MKPMGTMAAATGTMAATLALGGCGGGSKAPGPAPPPGRPAPARAQFIVQADAICQQARTSLAGLQARTRALIALGDSARAFAQAVPLFREVQSVERAELVRLEGLRLAAGDNTQVDAYLRAGTRAVGLVGRIADAFARGDKAALAAAEKQGSQMGAVARALAQGYGFKVCGHGSGGNGLS